jgi:hypothetical protein
VFGILGSGFLIGLQRALAIAIGIRTIVATMLV